MNPNGHRLRPFILAIVLAGSAAVLAQGNDPTVIARQFVAKCLSDTNVFVVNPPADLNLYRGMAPPEVAKLQADAMRNGSVLFLHLDGLPARFETRRDFKQNGLHKTWYQDGRVRTEEHYDHGKLITGVYFDKGGTVLGRIENGTGVKVVLSEDDEGNSGRIRGTAEYRNGLKDGTEVFYRDYENRLKSSEAHYKEGKLEGVQTRWMSTGEKNSEETYKDGVRDGRWTVWFKNGRIQSTANYVAGQPVGARTWFYENGMKASEYADRSEQHWYPSGQLMLEKTLGEMGRVLSGRSFDSLGHQNGSVTNGFGTLIGGETSSGWQSFHLSIYEGEKPPHSITLPRANVSDYSVDTNELRLSLRATAPREADWATGKVSVLLPEGCKSDGPLQFHVSHLQSGFSTNLGQVAITLPQSAVDREGTVWADVQGVVDGHTVRYQAPVFEPSPKEDRRVALPSRREQPKPKRTGTTLLRWRGNAAPHVQGQTIPPYRRAADYWQLAETVWVLYGAPGLLLRSKDNGDTWEVLRSDMKYRPCGLYVRSGNFILLWGTKPTRNPTRGIPYVVEKSRDGGQTWVPFRIPEVDYLLGIGGNERAITVSAIRLPTSGIPDGKDWFELPRTTFLSSDGKRFMEGAGFFQFGSGQITRASTAPNGLCRAFLSVMSWLDTSYTVYWTPGPDRVPVEAFSPDNDGDFLWSANSRILALKHEGKFVGYLDTLTGETGKESYMPFASVSMKEQAERAKFDARVRKLMEENAEAKPESGE